MTGLPDHNFPAFFEAAEHLKSLGWHPVNPAENFGGRRDLDREIYPFAKRADSSRSQVESGRRAYQSDRNRKQSASGRGAY